jgi:integrase
MGVRKINNNWSVDFRFNGRRYREKSPINTKAGAENYEARLKGKLFRGESVDKKQEATKKYKFRDFAWEWYENYVKTNNKYSEVRGKKLILISHLVPFFGKLGLENISGMDVEKYKTKKSKENLSKKTINNHLTVLNTCLVTAKEWLDLEKIPKIKKLKAEPPKTGFLSKNECKLLLDHSSGIWRDMILLALKTGVRFGELRALKWEDINWETKVLSVRRSVFRGVTVSPKSNKERYIPLLNKVIETLEQRERNGDYIFADKRGRMIEENRVRRELWRTCDKAGMDRVGWHRLRHTFASHLAMEGASLKSIQELLGHADIKTTMRYAHLSPSTLKKSVELLEERSGNENFGQNTGKRVEDILISNGIINLN